KMPSLVCFFPLAVRFGRIPKREKQRLMDEMQSYMNSLNGPASGQMEVPPPADGPCSPLNQTNTGPSSVSQSYPSEQKPVKMAAGSSSLGTPSFQSGAVQEVGMSAQNLNQVQVEQLNVATSYHLTANFHAAPCSNASSANANVSNANYSFSSNQNQCPVSGRISSQTFSHGVMPDRDNQNPMSCPWKLNGGAKVLACPLNSCPVAPASRSSQEVWESFSQCFTPAVKEVVEFAKSIPGFQSLSQHDQVMLLKSGTFQVRPSKQSPEPVLRFLSVYSVADWVLFCPQVLMVRFCSLFEPIERTVTFLNGQTYSLTSLRALGMGSLLDAMFDFSEKLGSLGLEQDEMALFMAVVLVSAGKSEKLA
ncbi:hypothetical protein GOODEAATRI_004254, partial [Goodea atripinnis]